MQIDHLCHVIVVSKTPVAFSGDSVPIEIQFLDGPLDGLSVEADIKKKYLPGDDGE